MFSPKIIPTQTLTCQHVTSDCLSNAKELSKKLKEKRFSTFYSHLAKALVAKQR